MSVQRAMLPGGRLHLQHGPIDLIIDATGPARQAALAAACARFDGLLAELVAELPLLRQAAGPAVVGAAAQRMRAAVLALRAEFVTPMAAVAGSVADPVLAAMTLAGPLTKAYVNNGGDVALYLGPGQQMVAAMDGTGDQIRVGCGDGVGGIAASGWRGRSHSLGIADSVTVLAGTAAAADAAATLVANAVTLPDHPAVSRRRACDLADDSDLGTRLVTTDVGPLTPSDVDRALSAGLARAGAYEHRGLIRAAYLSLQGQHRTLAPLSTLPSERRHA